MFRVAGNFPSTQHTSSTNQPIIRHLTDFRQTGNLQHMSPQTRGSASHTHRRSFSNRHHQLQGLNCQSNSFNQTCGKCTSMTEGFLRVAECRTLFILGEISMVDLNAPMNNPLAPVLSGYHHLVQREGMELCGGGARQYVMKLLPTAGWRSSRSITDSEVDRIGVSSISGSEKLLRSMFNRGEYM